MKKALCGRPLLQKDYLFFALSKVTGYRSCSTFVQSCSWKASSVLRRNIQKIVFYEMMQPGLGLASDIYSLSVCSWWKTIQNILIYLKPAGSLPL